MSRYAKDFEALGIRRGDTLLMHSSMKSLGTDLSPEAFLRELIEYLGAEGTLLLPAFTYQSVTPESPLFDAREAEPCVGLLPRTFFHMPGVRRSAHPTHSVCALGRLAEELTKDHQLDETPVGARSPLRKLPACGGKILLLGVSGTITFLHGVEEIVGAPYALNEERTRYIVIDSEGNRAERLLYGHNFRGYRQRYERAEALLDPPELNIGRIGNARCALYDAAALERACVRAMQADPYYFVDPQE